MTESYATIEDLQTLWRPLTEAETARAELLLPAVSDLLRQYAKNAGQDLDDRIAQEPTLETTARLVTIDVVGRVLRSSTVGEPMSSETQSALGYMAQGSYAIPGGGVAQAVMKNDLKALGIYDQRIGATNPYAQNTRHPCPPCG